MLSERAKELMKFDKIWISSWEEELELCRKQLSGEKTKDEASEHYIKHYGEDKWKNKLKERIQTIEEIINYLKSWQVKNSVAHGIVYHPSIENEKQNLNFEITMLSLAITFLFIWLHKR